MSSRWRRGTFVAVVVLGGLAWSACGGGAGHAGGGGLNSSDGSVKSTLNQGVVLVQRQAGGASPVLAQNGTSLTLSGVRSDIAVGNVVVSTVDNGALRKVDSIGYNGGTTVLGTTQASLAQAFRALDANPPLSFDQETIGNIDSGVPGLTLTWVPDQSTRGQRATYNKLKIDFAGLSLSTSKSITITGSATVSTVPHFECKVDVAPGKFLPSVASLKAGFASHLSGSMTVASGFGGDVGASRTWFDKDVGVPIVAGVLVFVPHLKIESEVTGTASGKFTHTQSLDVTTTADVMFERGSGFSSTHDLTPSITATESDVEAAYSIDLKPLSIEVSFNLYDVAGPYGQVNANVKAEGTHAVQNSVEGIDAVVTAGPGGEVGISASTPKLLAELFEAEWTPYSQEFSIAPAEVFHKFFPFTGTASITVGDNGPAADDIFLVQVDGVSLGQTDKGGTGAFRVTSLSPGPHTLTITCLDDGADGLDVGTLGLALDNGVTFEDGSTSLSDELSLNETKAYTIIFPSQLSRSRGAARLPHSRVAVEHPRRR